jgi:pimeloyl-ACP methyl ester carboxylesterase
MHRWRPILTFLLVVAAAPPLAAPDATWQRTREEAPLAGTTVRETRWTAVRPPEGPYDKVQVHRYRGRGPQQAALLYLPGTTMNGQVAVADEDHNLWLFLAQRGVEVFTLDYRSHFLPTAGLADFGFLRGWGHDAFLGDIRAAAELARRESGRDRLFVGGFSRGVTLGYLYAASEPARVAGLIALDGFLKSHAPRNAYDADAESEKLRAGSGWAYDVAAGFGWERRQQLMDAAAARPEAPALDPKYPTVGTQVADILYKAWRPGGLANPIGGYSRPQTLARLLAGYDRYYPAVQDVEGRSIADRPDDPRTPLDDAWGELTIPVLYFGATGMGADWLLDGIHSAAHSGATDVTLHVLEGYGHLDVIVGEKASRDVFEPTLAWIRERSK